MSDLASLFFVAGFQLFNRCTLLDGRNLGLVGQPGGTSRRQLHVGVWSRLHVNAIVIVWRTWSPRGQGQLHVNVVVIVWRTWSPRGRGQLHVNVVVI
eukprot:2339123-Pyramimonas_sp.AAC.1